MGEISRRRTASTFIHYQGHEAGFKLRYHKRKSATRAESVYMPHLLKVTAVQRAVPGRTSNSWGCSAASGSKGFSLHSTLRSGFSWYGNRIGVERQMSWLRITWDTKDVLDADPHLLSELSINRSSSSQKCSGIPSDSISAKLSPSTWPTQGWVTEFWVSLQDRNNCVQVTCRKWCTCGGEKGSRL